MFASPQGDQMEVIGVMAVLMLIFVTVSRDE